MLLRSMFLFVFLLCLGQQICALDNGLALTPPMGWLTWQRFRCNMDCENDPENCISENLIKKQADEMVNKGFLAAGYEYVIIDDCWLAPERDAEGRLQPDTQRFPSGIKALADYVHGLGLKFGIYEDIGTMTCAEYPGMKGHFEIDANTFAEWGVDYLKIDGCFEPLEDMAQDHIDFGYFLNQTGRPILYLCEWPLYLQNGGITPDYEAVAATCNTFRNYNDIQDSWWNDGSVIASHVLDIIDHYGDNQEDGWGYAKWAGPGHYNDPDMLVIGNFGLSLDQAVAQMTLWSVLAAPLIMSNDLRNIRPEMLEILQNAGAIRINQDPLGSQGIRMVHDMSRSQLLDIYVKEITPEFASFCSAAVALLHRGVEGMPTRVSFKPEDFDLIYLGGYLMSDAISGEDFGLVTSQQTVEFMVNPSGARLIRFDILS